MTERTYAVRDDREIENILEDIIKAAPRSTIFYLEPDLFYRVCMQLWDGSLNSYFVFQQREFRCKEES